MNALPYSQRVISGAERGPAAAALRAALSLAEPVYAAIVTARNRSYDCRPGRTRALPRPVVSIGNITTGGTGKTPVVRWLAERLREGGRDVAILSRGYKAARGAPGDEQRMLDRLLNTGGAAGGAAGVPRRPVWLHAHPDRYGAGEAALREHPEIDVFLLDDGFQHRRLARDLDVVLVRATEPFGYGHVLPRGLLREPLGGLGRAGAIVLTHADGVGAEERESITRELRRHNLVAPVYATIHAPVGLREARDGPVAGRPGGANAEDVDLPLERLAAVRAFAFCGIGNPGGFETELRRLCGQYVGHRWFADHHAYTAADVRGVRAAASRAGADVLVTTEKDWAKLAVLEDYDGNRTAVVAAAPPRLPIWRLDVAAQFLGNDGRRLLAQVEGILSGIRVQRTRRGWS